MQASEEASKQESKQVCKKCNISKYYQKNPLIWGHLRPFLLSFDQTRIFPKNRALSLLSPYGLLTSCVRPKNLMNKFLEKCIMVGRTDDRTDGRAGGWTDGRTVGCTVGCTEGRTVGCTEGNMCTAEISFYFFLQTSQWNKQQNAKIRT